MKKVVTFGEIMLRLSPPGFLRFSQTNSFEVVYGTAFGPRDGQPIKTPGGDVATFSVDSLRRSRPGKVL